MQQQQAAKSFTSPPSAKQGDFFRPSVKRPLMRNLKPNIKPKPNLEPKPSTARRVASQTKVNQEQIRQQQLKKLEALNKSHFLFPNGDVG
jgi:hypothetical protein